MSAVFFRDFLFGYRELLALNVSSERRQAMWKLKEKQIGVEQINAHVPRMAA